MKKKTRGTQFFSEEIGTNGSKKTKEKVDEPYQREDIEEDKYEKKEPQIIKFKIKIERPDE